MNIDTALNTFTAGHLTRSEAAVMFVWLIEHDPHRAAQYTDAINGLIKSGHIYNDQGRWATQTPTQKRGRPRGRKATKRIAVYLDPSMIEEIANHRLASVVSRNDLIKLLLRFALDNR